MGFMKITMVKKILLDGSPCAKCLQAEKLLKKRGGWERIDEFVPAREGEPESAGMKLGAEYGIETAPFFLVHPSEGEPRVYTRVLDFIRNELEAGGGGAPGGGESEGAGFDFRDAGRLENMEPRDILAEAQRCFGRDLALAFSGAEDAALIDMAWRNGLPFTVFCIDTGRLHPETYGFIDTVRERYDTVIEIFTPSPLLLEPFVREKGMNSFYRDGHAECCGIRKVEPLGRALEGRHAWAAGLRRDQSPVTRGNMAVVEEDGAHLTPEGRPLVKINPVLNWSSERIWRYIRENDVPFNPLHDAGYKSIGCAPCTRPARPGEHERMARWWWEDSTHRECGLHVSGGGKRSRG